MSDIAFGTPDNQKPTTSFVDAGVVAQTVNNINFPNGQVYDNIIQSNKFSIRAMESGQENEDTYIWYSGFVFFR